MRNLLILLLYVVAFPTIGKAQTLTLAGNQFRMDDAPFEMRGIRVASATQGDSLTEQLIANLDTYQKYGVNTISVYLQGSSGGFSDPFRDEGKTLDEDHLRRLKQVVEACRERSMVAIVGIFYQRVMGNQNDTRRLHTKEMVIQATETTAELLRPYRNVIINIANEQNSSLYRQFEAFDFNDPQNIIALCQRAKQIEPRTPGGRRRIPRQL